MDAAYKNGIRALKKYALDNDLMNADELKEYSFDKKTGKGLQQLYEDLLEIENPTPAPAPRVNQLRAAKSGKKVSDDGLYENHSDQLLNDLGDITHLSWSVRNHVYVAQVRSLKAATEAVFRIAEVSRHLNPDEIEIHSDLRITVKPHRFDML